MSSNWTKRHGTHLNVIYIIELLLFSVMNIFVLNITYVRTYPTTFRFICRTAVPSESVCYGSILRLYPSQIAVL